MNVTNIISDQKAQEAVEQFIKKPLESGLSQIGIKSRDVGEIAKIEKKDASAFVPFPILLPPQSIQRQQEIDMTLLIESATFKEGNKWRFSDGENSFGAAIIDEEFLKKIDQGERFGKGDELVARIRFTQSGTFGSLRTDRTIVRVLEHKIPPKTNRLFKFD